LKDYEDGLWSLAFGPGLLSFVLGALYFDVFCSLNVPAGSLAQAAVKGSKNKVQSTKLKWTSLKQHGSHKASFKES
jgi:hypothetical protein